MLISHYEVSVNTVNSYEGCIDGVKIIANAKTKEIAERIAADFAKETETHCPTFWTKYETNLDKNNKRHIVTNITYTTMSIVEE